MKYINTNSINRMVKSQGTSIKSALNKWKKDCFMTLKVSGGYVAFSSYDEYKKWKAVGG